MEDRVGGRSGGSIWKYVLHWFRTKQNSCENRLIICHIGSLVLKYVVNCTYLHRNFWRRKYFQNSITRKTIFKNSKTIVRLSNKLLKKNTRAKDRQLRKLVHCTLALRITNGGWTPINEISNRPQFPVSEKKSYSVVIRRRIFGRNWQNAGGNYSPLSHRSVPKPELWKRKRLGIRICVYSRTHWNLEVSSCGVRRADWHTAYE